jgi:hypothetical protein
MLVMVAGPVGRLRGLPVEEVEANLGAIRRAALEVWRRGHVPVVGVHEAYPLIELLEEGEAAAAMVDAISNGLAERCDAIVLLGHSAAALEEARRVAAHGGTVFESAAQLPDAGAARP